MACIRIACFVTDKILKTFYILLLIVIMTLWIALSVEAGRQINEVYQHHKMGSGSGSGGGGGGGSGGSGGSTNANIRLKAEEARRLPGSFAAASAASIVSVTRGSINRLYALTVFNTILEELIAFFALISVVLRSRRLFNITLLLLIVIWFIEQYRISDFYHQIDHIDYRSGQIMIATHVIHFLIVLIGVLLSVGNSAGRDLASRTGASGDIEKAGASHNNGRNKRRVTTTSTNDDQSHRNHQNNHQHQAQQATASSDQCFVTPSISSFVNQIGNDRSRRSSGDDSIFGANAADHDNLSTSPQPPQSEPPVKRIRCAWMRKTFVKSRCGDIGDLVDSRMIKTSSRNGNEKLQQLPQQQTQQQSQRTAKSQPPKALSQHRNRTKSDISIISVEKEPVANGLQQQQQQQAPITVIADDSDNVEY